MDIIYLLLSVKTGLILALCLSPGPILLFYLKYLRYGSLFTVYVYDGESTVPPSTTVDSVEFSLLMDLDEIWYLGCYCTLKWRRMNKHFYNLVTKITETKTENKINNKYK